MKSLLSFLLLLLASTLPSIAFGQFPDNKATLRQLFIDQHAWAIHVVEYEAPLAASVPEPWADRGHWLQLAGDMTGKPEYYQQAIKIAGRFPEFPTDRNHLREMGQYYPILYGQLKPHMTDLQRKDWERKLNQWAKSCLGLGATNVQCHAEDSDEVVGFYTCLAVTDKVLGTRYLQETTTGQGGIPPAVMRSQLIHFCQLSKGGVWPESLFYNLGTMQLLLLGTHYVGIDQFPEVKALLPEFTDYLCWTVTSDMADCAQWGDDQNPHDLLGNRRYQWVSLGCQLIALGGDTSGEHAGRLANLVALLTNGKPVRHYSMDLNRALWVLDPRTLPTSSVPNNPQGLRVAEGAGIILYRQADLLFQVHFPLAEEYVDHSVPYFGDVRLWFNDEWIVDHPLGYGAAAQASNAALAAGLGQMHHKELISTVKTPNGCKLVGRTYGPRHLHLADSPFAEWTRSIELKTDLQSTSEYVLIEVKDSFLGKRPIDIERYYPQERQLMTDALAQTGLWTQVWHAPTEPQETATGFEYLTEKGQKVILKTNAVKKLKRREQWGVTLDGNFHPGEIDGWQIVLVGAESGVPTGATNFLFQASDIITTLQVGQVPATQPPPEPQPEPPPAPTPLKIFSDGKKTYRVFSERLEVIEEIPLLVPLSTGN